MAEFDLKNNYFEFNGKVKKQISDIMDQVETEFLKTQNHKALVWFRYIDDVFFILTHGKKTIILFLEDLNNFYPNIKFSLRLMRKAFIF